MRFFIIRCIMLAVMLGAMVACDLKDAPPPRLEGAWLGTGQFHSGYGDQDVKAQLELLPDGTYRYLILEPGILALVGAEKGEWKRTGDVLDLTPVEDPEEKRGGLFGSTPRNFQPKSLTITEGMESLVLKDGKMELEFVRKAEGGKRRAEN